MEEKRLGKLIFGRAVCFLLSGTFVLGSAPLGRAHDYYEDDEPELSGFSLLIRDNPSTFGSILALTLVGGAGGIGVLSLMLSAEKKEVKRLKKEIEGLKSGFDTPPLINADLTTNTSNDSGNEDPEVPKVITPAVNNQVNSLANTNLTTNTTNNSDNNEALKVITPAVDSQVSNPVNTDLTNPLIAPTNEAGNGEENPIIVNPGKKSEEYPSIEQVKNKLFKAGLGGTSKVCGVSSSIGAFKDDICQLYYDFHSGAKGGDEVEAKLEELAKEKRGYSMWEYKLNEDEQRYVRNWIYRGSWDLDAQAEDK